MLRPDIFKTAPLFTVRLFSRENQLINLTCARQTHILPKITIAHISSGTFPLILLNLLSCFRLEHCKTAGRGRLRDANVPVIKVGLWPMAQDEPELAPLVPVVKCLEFKTHLLLSVKSFQHLRARCISK